MSRAKQLVSLFLTFLKIGAFTFGGGYAMIALIQHEVSDRRGWIGKDEMLDMVAIAESTPGPIAINAATYVGYHIASVGGAAAATLGVVLPSFTILFVISLFFDAFLALPAVGWAFAGIRAAVCYLILSAGIRMIRGLRRSALTVVLLSLTMAALLLCTLFAVRFSTVFYVLIGGACGVAVYLIGRLRRKKDGKEKADGKEEEEA